MVVVAAAMAHLRVRGRSLLPRRPSVSILLGLDNYAVPSSRRSLLCPTGVPSSTTARLLVFPQQQQQQQQQQRYRSLSSSAATYDERWFGATSSSSPSSSFRKKRKNGKRKWVPQKEWDARKRKSEKTRGKQPPPSRNKKQKRQEQIRLPTVGPNQRPILSRDVLQQPPTTELAIFLAGHPNLSDVVAWNVRWNQMHNALGFQPRYETTSIDLRGQHVFTTTIHTTLHHCNLLLPHLTNPPADAELQDDTLTLCTTGRGPSKRDAKTMAIIDALFQFQHECGVDLENAPNLHKLLAKQKTQQLAASKARAIMLLELCKAPYVTRPRFDTTTVGNHSTTEMTLHVGSSSSSRSRHDRQRLVVTGSRARNSKESIAHAMEAAAGEPLTQAMGAETMQALHRWIDTVAPAQHMTPLNVHPLPQHVRQILREALGSVEERRERLRQVEELQQRFEEQLARKTQAQWQARLEIEEGKLSSTSSLHAHKKLSKADQKYQDMMYQQEQQRVLNSGAGSRRPSMLEIRDALPITAIRNSLSKALKEHQVVVVSGGTGSGKSTQCPQYILEDAIRHGQGPPTRIVVTQPRRIAAISVAERVADERGEGQPGHSVGYTVRHNRVAPRSCGGSIEFVTTGVLLRRLQNDRTLQGISHVVIDEVHERDINTDFLLVLLKDLVAKRRDLNVILMSATLDAEGFSKYFARGVAVGEEDRQVPYLSVPTQPRFPVEMIHLEDLAGESSTTVDSDMLADFPSDLRRMAASILREQDNQLSDQLSEAEKEVEFQNRFSSVAGANERLRTASERLEVLRAAVQMREDSKASSSSSLQRAAARKMTQRDVDILTVELIAKLALHVATEEQRKGHKGSVLCFLPGWDEIKAAMTVVGTSHRNLIILPLHSTIPKEEQHRIFEPAGEGCIKVIFATNIAESSVTINDALAIVDSGLVREMNWDPKSAMSTMETIPTSQASATQRKGRAGRVAPGKCYRLFSNGGFHAMNERNMPEIQRTGLDSTCLQACGMADDSVQSFLSRAMDPPPEDTVAYALKRLKLFGAINDTPAGERLTGLGSVLSRLPVDPAIGRMLLFGCITQCLDPILTAAACLSSRSPFFSPPGQRDEASEKRRVFSATSDLVASVRAYNTYIDMQRTAGWDATWQWAQEHFVSPAAMNRISTTKSQLLDELRKLGLVDHEDIQGRSRRGALLRQDALVNSNAENQSLYSGVWATGLPGNLAARKRLDHFGTMQTRMIPRGEIHPSSVAFHRMPPKDDTELPDWFLYHEIVHSSNVFIRNITKTTPEQIMLFGGLHLQITEDLDSNGPLCGQRVLDEWILVKSPCSETVELMEAVRDELKAALVLKAMSPRQELPETSQRVVDSIAKAFQVIDGTSTENQSASSSAFW